MPLKLAEHAIYLAGGGVCALVVTRLTGSRWLALIVFAVLALNPVLWGPHFSRTIRDGLYVGLTLLSFGGVAFSALVDTQRSRPTLWGPLTALFVGAAVGIFWLTRQEGVWLLPALLLVTVGGAWLFGAALGGPHKFARRQIAARVGRRFGPRVLSVGAGVALVIGATAAQNAAVYGMPIVNDFTDGSFPALYGAITRIEHDVPERYVPAPEAARRQAYEVSDAAAELEPFLEGDIGAHWTLQSCGGPPDPSRGCTDIRGGWFVWALRDAVAAAGHWTSIQESQAFMQRAADEINVGCDRGRIRCAEARSGTAPPIGIGTMTEALRYFPPALLAMTGAGTTIRLDASLAETDDLIEAALLYGRVAPPPAGDRAGSTRVKGWVAALGSTPRIHAAAANPSSPDVEITEGPGLDVEDFLSTNGFPRYRAVRFELATRCADCLLVVDAAGATQRVQIGDLREGRLLEPPALAIHIDSVEVPRADPVLSASFHWSSPTLLTAMRFIQAVYATAVPPLLAVAVAGTLAAVSMRRTRRAHGGLIILTLACVLAVVTRTTLIALIEVTSWPGAIGDAYLGPAAPLLLIFAVLGTYLAGTSVSLVLPARPSQRQPDRQHSDGADEEVIAARFP